MEVTFIGVGEEFDRRYPSTSILVKSKKESILLGCGYNVVQPFLKKYGKTLNGIYVPNMHMSSIGGLVPLLMHLEGSTSVIAQDNVEGIVRGTIADYEPDYKFDFDFQAVKPGDNFTLGNFKLTFAYTESSLRNMAVRIDDGKSVLCFSGDGNFTDKSNELYYGADLLIHEAYNLNKKTYNHSNIVDVLEMAKSYWVKKLALVSLREDLRPNPLRERRQNLLTGVRENPLRKVQKEIDKAKLSRMKVILPTPDYITLI